MDFSKLNTALEAAEAKAKELKANVSIAIVDEYGCLVAFKRMENAIKVSPKFAITKANTSAYLGMPTSQIAPFAEEGKPYHGIDSIFGGELTTIAGGVPIKNGEQLVGGVGVGGSMDVKQDEECAQAAAAILTVA